MRPLPGRVVGRPHGARGAGGHEVGRTYWDRLQSLFGDELRVVATDILYLGPCLRRYHARDPAREGKLVTQGRRNGRGERFPRRAE